MNEYLAKTKVLTGTDFREVRKKAELIYRQIKSRSKRRPYIRSAYFNKEKVFIALFWQHLFEKKWQDRLRRLKYFSVGIELLQKSKCKPIMKINPNKPSEKLYRFKGTSSGGAVFFVQIKENRKTKQKHLLSIFPEK